MTMTKKKSNPLMFMSADIVGSTDFKQMTSVDDDNVFWLSPFETFSREFPLVLMVQIASTCTTLPGFFTSAVAIAPRWMRPAMIDVGHTTGICKIKDPPERGLSCSGYLRYSTAAGAF